MQATQTMSSVKTQNTLDADQRLRLVRSARKLGAMLGASTILLDHDTDLSTTSSRSPSPKMRLPIGPGYTTNMPNSSLASLASSASIRSSSSLPIPSSATPLAVKASSSYTDLSETNDSPSRSKRSRARPPPLILTTRVVPVSSDDHRAQQRTPIQERVAYPQTPRTPFSPLKTPPPPPSTRERRQRMARKITRQLGESVPPSLIILPPTPGAKVPPPTTNISLPTVPPLPALTQTTSSPVVPPPTKTCKIVWDGEWNRDREDVVRGLRSLKAVR